MGVRFVSQGQPWDDDCCGQVRVKAKFISFFTRANIKLGFPDDKLLFISISSILFQGRF